MLVSLEWIKDYVDIEGISAKEFCDRMTMSGSCLETCEEIGIGMEGVKLGRIEKIEKHPDADKLNICMVNLGEKDLVQIVTGAPNIFEGAYVPVATDGSTVPGPLHGHPETEGGVKITAGKLRGVDSFGMMCGAQELGYDDKVVPMNVKDGLWILDGDWSEHLGEDFDKALGLHDYKVDFEITPNRPDCLSMIGMAREAAATFGKTLKYPETDATVDTSEKAEDYISVEIKSDLAKRYTARVIKDVKIGPSPWWMQKKLMAAGMRPINNMIDITNFVMLEYGQPLHAFDIESIEDRKIIVDTAKEGDVFVTLDGKERTLDETMLMINDGKKPVAVAGIMGGLNSEITDETTTVVIESANFEGSSVRQTSKKLGLRTEASGRYEKGIDPNLCHEAADRVCKLVEMLGCGRVLDGAVDIYKNPEVATPVKARVSRINKVIGIDIPREEMVKYFESLEMKVEGEGDELIVTAPTVRIDMNEEVDCIEEVARMYGYDNIPMTFPNTVTKAEFPISWQMREIARDTLCSMAANEIKTFSFINDKILDNTGIDPESWERDTIKLINPMGEDTAAMRTILTPGMLEVLGRNFSRKIPAVRAYEIGNTYVNNYIEEDGLPDEAKNLTIGLYGEGESFFTLKGMIEELLNVFGIKNVLFEAESEYGVYHPGRCARILVDPTGIDEDDRKAAIEQMEAEIKSGESLFGEKELNSMKELVESLAQIQPEEPVEIGIMGEVHPDVAKNYGIGTRAYVCEILFDLMCEFASDEVHYAPLPKYPSTSRDIALLVDEDVPVGDMVRAIKLLNIDILENIEIFDIYRGEQVEEGKKSVAIALTYRHSEKTLTDEETQVEHGKILEMLANDFNASLREL